VKPRVLVVDDSLTVRMDLAESFAEAGFDAVPCASAADARAAAAAAPVDAVVLARDLPDGDGLALVAELRGPPAGVAGPLVLLGSEAAGASRALAGTPGPDAWIATPYEPAHVVARVRSLLPAPAARAALLVLVIDDSTTFREELAGALRAAGYRAETAVDGLAGVQRAAELRPDVVVVDGVMPGLDGAGVVRRLRLDPALRATPCLLLTASAAGAGEIDALEAGADAYLQKNEGIPMVLVRLHALLRTAPESRDHARTRDDAASGPAAVLAVDDSPTFLDQLTEALAVEGYRVHTAASGEGALERLRAVPVDCILLDRLMPGLSGTETCRRIKQDPALRRIPLIMLTALDERAAMLEGIEAGADDYIAKSAEFDVLRARLRAQLRRKRFEDEHRRVREELLRKEGETRAARERADAHATLLTELQAKNGQLAHQAAELAALNRELGTFAYSVSHDLRQPLRAVDGFSRVLVERYAGVLDAGGRDYLERVRGAARRMGALIDGLLVLSRVTRAELAREPVALDALAGEVVAQLRAATPARAVEVAITPGLRTAADRRLTASLLENLLGNAWKFTAGRNPAHIAVGATPEGAWFVRDDGVGFDMAYADKLFGPFQRLHSPREFEGTGIGLATAQRIVHRHGGRIWAQSTPGAGATFFFTLAPEVRAGDVP
jgi:DNA-binding response OmpR family regulator